MELKDNFEKIISRNHVSSSDIIANEVRKFWKKTFPCDVVAFFSQKYDFEKEWEECNELIFSKSDSDYETVYFGSDFCEGQTEVKDIHLVLLEDVLDFYRENKINNLRE